MQRLPAGDTLLDRLRQRGWRLSAQRRAVAEALKGTHVHMTADEVLSTATAILPEVSRATVYNTLNELVALGEVSVVVAGNGPKRYDPNAHHRHQHLLCVSCERLLDVVPEGSERLRLPPSERHGYQILDVDVVFRGICPACASSGRNGQGHEQ